MRCCKSTALPFCWMMTLLLINSFTILFDNGVDANQQIRYLFDDDVVSNQRFYHFVWWLTDWLCHMQTSVAAVAWFQDALLPRTRHWGDRKKKKEFAKKTVLTQKKYVARYFLMNCYHLHSSSSKNWFTKKNIFNWKYLIRMNQSSTCLNFGNNMSIKK